MCNTQWRIDFIVVLQQHSLFLKNTSKVHLFIISDSFKRILTWPFKEFVKEDSIKRKICQRLSLSYPILCFYLVLTIPVRLYRHLYSTVELKKVDRFEEINDLIYKHHSFVVVCPFIFGFKCTTVYCSKLE